MHVRPIAASLLLAAAGCGDISTVSPDATPADAAPDDPELGTVSVELRNPFSSNSVPLPGSTMLVVMPDGTVIGDDVTDDDGLASVDGVPAGAILLLFPEIPTGAPENFTIAVYDVGPGDEIHFGRDDAQGEMLGTMSIQLPAVKDPAPTYHASNGCDSEDSDTTTIPLTFYESCVDGGDSDVLAWAVGQSGDVLAYLDVQRPFADAGNMDLTAVGWGTPDTIDVTLTDLPAEASSVSFQVHQMLGHNEYGFLLSQNLDTPDPDMELSAKVPASFGDSTRINLGFSPNQSALGEQLLSHRAEGDVEWALDEELLPWYSSGIYSVEDRRMSWSRTAGREPDAHYVILQWVEEDTDVEGAWFTVSPPDREELALPPLPAEWEEHLPVAPAMSIVQLYAAESSVVDGYEAARLIGFDLVGEDPINDAPAGATMRLSLGAGSGF